MNGKRSYRIIILLLLIELCLLSSIAVDRDMVSVHASEAQARQGVANKDDANDNDGDNDGDNDSDNDGDNETGEDQDEPDDNNDSADADESETPAAEGYEVDLTAADFVKVVDNPYFPLIPGTRWVYEGKLADGGVEHTELEILHESRQVNGVTATILHDSVFQDGALVEETFDWFAQDKEGNVWYLGEDVNNYENGVLINHDGSWEWGVDGALPGVNMWADPAAHRVEAYRQEYYIGVAEDFGLVLSASESVTVPVGSFQNVVQTYDFSSLKTNIQGHKFYAPGVGIIKEVELLTGEEAVLVEYTPAGPPPPPTPTPELLPQPTTGLPPGIAPDSARVDMVKPTFTNPTLIDNPLLPITEVEQIIQVGHKEGKPHRTEFTLLPGTKSIAWNGEQTEVRMLQFVAYLDGRILEHAIDYLAQADGGAVWYFGEDVFNYEDGIVADHEGTWLAGQDGPPAMIMPAHPRVGNVYRVENFPSKAFEEVTVMAVNQTLEGPRGLIKGVMFVQQIGLERKTTVKAFAPGYGEFLAHSEDAAVAVPTDALSTPLPAELEILLTGAKTIFTTASPEDWDAISATLGAMSDAWNAHQSAVDLGNLFPLLDEQMAQAFNALTAAVEQRNPEEMRKAAYAVAVATLDLQMPYQPRPEIDLARFDLWAQRVLVDVQAGDPGAVKGDVTTLELVRDRFAHLLDNADHSAIDTLLVELRAAADTEKLEMAATSAGQLLDLLAKLELTRMTG